MLRAIAAMLVVLFHAQQAFARRFEEPAFENESYLFAFGGVGVHIFFVISGFIMVYTSASTRKFNIREFYRRRLLRIYPIYWICVLFFFSAHFLLGQSIGVSPSRLIGALLLLPGNAAAIIGPAWTLAFEMFFYLSFGLAMTAGLSRGLILLGSAFVVLIALGSILDVDNPMWNLVTDALLVEFLAGSAIGWLLVKGFLPRRGGIALVALACVLFLAGIAWGYEQLPSVVVWGIPSVLLIMGAVILETTKKPAKLVCQLGYFGDSSYALYLIHILVITLFIALAHEVPLLTKVEPALMALLIALVALVLSEVLHHGVERPLLRKLHPRQPPILGAEKGFDL